MKSKEIQKSSKKTILGITTSEKCMLKSFTSGQDSFKTHGQNHDEKTLFTTLVEDLRRTFGHHKQHPCMQKSFTSGQDSFKRHGQNNDEKTLSTTLVEDFKVPSWTPQAAPMHAKILHQRAG